MPRGLRGVCTPDQRQRIIQVGFDHFNVLTIVHMPARKGALHADAAATIVLSSDEKLDAASPYVVVAVGEVASVLGLQWTPAQMIKGLTAAGARLMVLK